jgi:hypothetical protein
MSDEEIDSFAATLTESPDVQTLDFPVLTDAVDPPRQAPAGRDRLRQAARTARSSARAS